MSIVTVGTGIFASDWASALNYDLVTRVSTSGEISRYNPAADTDVARGTALIAASTAVIDGDTLIINGGTYDLVREGLLIQVSCNLVGLGNPVLITRLPNAGSASGFEFGLETDTVNISGITFRTNALDADYAGGHFYNLNVLAAGNISKCNLVMNSAITTIDGGDTPKNFVGIGVAKQRMEDCTVFSVGTAAVPMYHGAFHDTGGDPATEFKSWSGCSLLGQFIDPAEFISPPIFYNCKNNLPSKFNPQLLNLYEARSLVGSFADDILGESNYVKYTQGISQKDYHFTAQVEVGTDWRTLFQIEDANGTSAGVTNMYEVEVSAAMNIQGWGIKQYYYRALVRAGVATVISEFDDTGAAPLNVRWVLNASAPDEFQIQEVGTGNNYIFADVRFTPRSRAGTTNAIEGAQQYGSQIVFTDISE